MKQLFSVENLSRIFENPEQIEYSLKNLNSILKTERKNIVSKIDTLLQKVPTRSNCSSFIKSFELVLCSFNDILLEKYDIKLDEDVSKKIKKIESLTLFTCIISATISNMVKKHSVIDNYSFKLTVASTHFKKSLKNVLYHYIMYLLLDKTKNQNEHSEKLSDQKIYFDNVSRFDYLVAYTSRNS